MSENRPHIEHIFEGSKTTRPLALVKRCAVAASSFFLCGLLIGSANAEQPWGPMQQFREPGVGVGLTRSRSETVGGVQGPVSEKSLGKQLITAAHNYAQNVLGLEYGQYEIRQTGNARNPRAAQTKIVVRGGANKEFTVGGAIPGSNGSAQSAQSLTFSNFKTGDVQFILTGGSAGSGQAPGADGLLLRNAGLDQAKAQLGPSVPMGDDAANRNVLLTLDPAGGPSGWKAQAFDNREVGNNKFSVQLGNAKAFIVAAEPGTRGGAPAQAGQPSQPLTAQAKPTSGVNPNAGGGVGGSQALHDQLGQAQGSLNDLAAQLNQPGVPIPPEIRQKLQELTGSGQQLVDEAEQLVTPPTTP